MARIRPYEQSVSADSGIRQEIPQAGGEHVAGRGLEPLAQGIESAGDSAQRASVTLDEVKSREEVTNAQTNLVVAEQDMTTRLNDLESKADPKDRSLPDRFAAEVGNYLAGLDDRYTTRNGSEAFKAGASRLSAKLMADASLADSRMAAKSAQIDYQTMLDTQRNMILTNPSSMHDQMVQAEAMLNDPNGQYARISSIARQELIRSTNSQYALSAAQGMIREDPEKALGMLQGGFFEKYLDADRTYTLARQAEIGMHAKEVEADRVHRQLEWARKEEVRAIDGQLVAKLGQGKLTTDDVMGATSADGHTLLELDPIRAESFLNLIHTRSREQLQPVQTDPQTRLNLFLNIHAPAGDPAKVKNELVINDAYSAGKLSWDDFLKLRKEFDEARTPDGEKLGQKRADMVKAVTGAIDKSNMLLGKLDPTAGLMLYAYKDAMEKEIARYQKEGKDVEELFNPDPSNKAYLGRPGFVAQFQKTWQQSLAYFTEQTKRGAGVVTPEGSVPEPLKRQGDETPKGYLERLKNTVMPPAASATKTEPTPNLEMEPRNRMKAQDNMALGSMELRTLLPTPAKVALAEGIKKLQSNEISENTFRDMVVRYYEPIFMRNKRPMSEMTEAVDQTIAAAKAPTKYKRAE